MSVLTIYLEICICTQTSLMRTSAVGRDEDEKGHTTVNYLRDYGVLHVRLK